MKKPDLPIEVHDHFNKANVLHTYVQKDLKGATKHALAAGNELIAAKSTVPHGRWEIECERLFDGSARTAQFYMQFARNISALPKAQSSSLLVLEGSLAGAAKAARKAAKPEKKPTAAEEGKEDAVWLAQQTMKTWVDAIGRWMSGRPAGICEYQDQFPGPRGDRVFKAAKELLNALDAWKKGLK